MAAIDQRAALERLVRESGSDYASLSRLLGRNPAYVQQFIKRGVPRKLDEEDRKILARFFGVDEAELGGPQGGGAAAGEARLVAVPRLDVGASAGAGASANGERALSHLAFEGQWLRQLCRGRPGDVTMIRVEGDSMSPTLDHGDEILVDRLEAGGRVRDGVYVLRREDALLVKRIAVNPAAGTLSITSDNPAYPGWPDCPPASVNIIGRVVWVGRRINYTILLRVM